MFPAKLRPAYGAGGLIRQAGRSEPSAYFGLVEDCEQAKSLKDLPMGLAMWLGSATKLPPAAASVRSKTLPDCESTR